MDKYEETVQFIGKCRSLGICHACGFSHPFHTLSCFSEEAAAARLHQTTEVVDALYQLLMSLTWNEKHTDEYKRRVFTEAVKFVYRKWQTEG